MAYTIEYKFQKTIFDYSEEHVALIIDTETDESVMCISGLVIQGWTKEALMARAEEWISTRNHSQRSIFETALEGEGGGQDNSYEFGESAQSRAEDARYQQSQAEHDATNAKRVAAEYGGVAIKIADTAALEAAGCVYAPWQDVDMNTDGEPESHWSNAWQKDGRLLTIICQDYYLVL